MKQMEFLMLNVLSWPLGIKLQINFQWELPQIQYYICKRTAVNCRSSSLQYVRLVYQIFK